MLADQFGVPLDHVTIHHGDTAVVKQGIGTFGSRSQAVGGAALHAVVSLPWPCGEAPVAALMRPSRSTVTCE